MSRVEGWVFYHPRLRMLILCAWLGDVRQAVHAGAAYVGWQRWTFKESVFQLPLENEQ